MHVRLVPHNGHFTISRDCLFSLLTHGSENPPIVIVPGFAPEWVFQGVMREDGSGKCFNMSLAYKGVATTVFVRVR